MTFEVILHKMKNLHPHNIYQNRIINECAKKSVGNMLELRNYEKINFFVRYIGKQTLS